MPRKKSNKTKEEKAAELKIKNRHKLNSIKTDFEAGRIKSFSQIYAVMVLSSFAKEVKMGFTTLKNKSGNPSDFTINELMRFSEALNVDINIVLNFIFSLIKQHRRKIIKIE